MFFQSPEEGNLIFSDNATDRFGKAGQVADAYNLKVLSSSRLVTQRLIIAGVIGAIVQVALVTWAMATISTRRKKQRP